MAQKADTAGFQNFYGSLEARSQAIVTASLAPSTKSTYKRALDGLISFRGEWALGAAWPTTIRKDVAFILGDSLIKHAGNNTQIHGGGEVLWNSLSGACLAGLGNRLRYYLNKNEYQTTLLLHLGSNNIFVTVQSEKKNLRKSECYKDPITMKI